MEDIQKFHEWLTNDRGREVIGLDIESTGLSAFKKDSGIRLVQIGDYNSGWAIPWERFGGIAIEALQRSTQPIALHNANFDLKFFQLLAKEWKIPWHRISDTMIMAKLMRPGKPAALKNLATEFIDPRANVGQALLDAKFKEHGWFWHDVPVDLPEYWAYGALDPILTAHLWKHFRADLKYPKAYDQEMGVLRVCSNMELRGARIDVDYCAQKAKELDDYNERIQKWSKDELGFSISSPAALGRYLKDLGADFTPDMITASGSLSVKAEFLERFIETGNDKVKYVAKVALDARKFQKIKSTYFESWLEKHDDGILHGSINTIGAVTGRMSSSNPNLQQIPSGDDDGPFVKSAFIPMHEDGAIFTSDLDQVEFRIFSCLSGDKGLQETFHRADANGSDSFTEIGREVYDDPDMQKSDPRRSLVKTYIYSKLFGASLEKQAKSAGVSVEVMRKFANDLNAKYPRMEQWQKEVIRETQLSATRDKDGFVTIPVSGREIPVERGAEYRAINYLCQGSAADVMKRNLLKLDAAGLGEYLVFPVHDEIVMDPPKDLIPEIAPVVRDCMTTTEGWEVALTGDISDAYPTWGAKYVKK
jgi:DNA polymerase-1